MRERRRDVERMAEPTPRLMPRHNRFVLSSSVGVDLMLGDIWFSFANDNNGTPGSADTGQPFLRSVAASGIVQATVSNGALVAADSGQSTTAAYTTIACREEIRSMQVEVIFGDANDNVTLVACGGYPDASIGPSGAEILYSSIHVGWTTTGWFIQYGTGVSLTTVASGLATIAINTRVKLGWFLVGTSIYLQLADGSTIGPYTDSNLTSRTNHYACFEHFRNATGTPLIKILRGAVNLFPNPTAAGRTNLLLAQNNLGSGSWTKVDATITAGQNDADGSTNADKVLEAATTNNHYNYQQVAKAASALPYSLRAKVKPINGRWFELAAFNNTFSAGLNVFFNPNTGVVGTPGGAFTHGSWSIYPLPNGYYQCQIDFTTDTGTTNEVFLDLASADTVDNYAGDVTKGLFIYDQWLFQRV